MSFEEVKTRALSLTLKERAALVRLLLASLEEPSDMSEGEVSALWVQEAQRRLEAVNQGTMRVYSAEEYGRIEEAWHRRVLEERHGGEPISLEEMKEQLGL